MKSLLATSFVCLLFAFVRASTDYRTNLVNTLIDQVTEFFESNQMAGYCEVGMGKVIEHATPSEISGALYDAAYNNLTSSQYSKAFSTLMQAEDEYGSMEKVNATIQKCVSGAAPIVKKYYPKIWKVIAAAEQQADKLNAGYKFAIAQCSNSLWKKIAKGCKSKLSSSDWSKAVQLVKPYLKLSNFGVSS